MLYECAGMCVPMLCWIEELLNCSLHSTIIIAVVVLKRCHSYSSSIQRVKFARPSTPTNLVFCSVQYKNCLPTLGFSGGIWRPNSRNEIPEYQRLGMNLLRAQILLVVSSEN